MRILVCVDFSETTEKIILAAEKLAQQLSAKAWILHVVAPEPDFVGFDVGPKSVRDYNSKDMRSEHRQIQKLADRMRLLKIDTTALLVQGATVETILKQASKLGADMILLGSHGRSSMRDLLIGSVSKGVLRNTDLPLVIIPTHARA